MRREVEALEWPEYIMPEDGRGMKARSHRGQEGRGAVVERPSCVRCRRAMQSGGRDRGRQQRWKCAGCGGGCYARRARRTHSDESEDPRPRCVACRRVMIVDRRERRPCPRWQCRGCRATCRVQVVRGESYARHNEESERPPWCVTCRRVMRSGGAGLFKCGACGVSLNATPKLYRPRRHVERPDCAGCGFPMALGSGPGRFACRRCPLLRRRLRESPEAAATLLKSIAGALPAYLTPDEREDAAQSIIADVLAAKFAPRVPSAADLRRYAREARGMVSDRYSFVSLSQPISNGREFGETLAA